MKLYFHSFLALTSDQLKRDYHFSLSMTGAFICFFINAWLAAFQAGKGVISEIIHHSTLLPLLETQGGLYSLWYILQKVISLNNHQPEVLIASGYLLLAMLFLLKGAMISNLIIGVSRNVIFGIFVSTLIFICAPVIIPWYSKFSPGFGISTMYLGDIPPNTFMSATQHIANIFAIPCVLFLGRYILEPNSQRLLAAGGFSVLAVIAKPGMSLGILTAWALGVIYLYRHKRLKSIDILGFILIVAIISADVLWVYNTFLSGNWLGIKTAINPFLTWNFYSAHPLIDLLRSWLFPMSVPVSLLILKSCDEEDFILLGTSWIVAAMSVIPFIIFIEVKKGIVVYPGNYMWGAIAATSALYFISAYTLVKKSPKVAFVPTAILIWSALSGIKYMTYFAKTGNFM